MLNLSLGGGRTKFYTQYITFDLFGGALEIVKSSEDRKSKNEIS